VQGLSEKALNDKKEGVTAKRIHPIHQAPGKDLEIQDKAKEECLVELPSHLGSLLSMTGVRSGAM
jgi:hypothetical protein